MPSFDIVSEVDMHELTNAVDQSNREISNRFDFKGTDSRVERQEAVLTLLAPAEFQVKQVMDILVQKLSKRGIDVGALDEGAIEVAVHQAKQLVTVKQGIDAALARKIVKLIKDSKAKVQAAIQGEKVRVTGKKRDDLQGVMSMLREAKLEQPVQFDNFRD